MRNLKNQFASQTPIFSCFIAVLCHISPIVDFSTPKQNVHTMRCGFLISGRKRVVKSADTKVYHSEMALKNNCSVFLIHIFEKSQEFRVRNTIQTPHLRIAAKKINIDLGQTESKIRPSKLLSEKSKNG